jgi:hypothetical protein
MMLNELSVSCGASQSLCGRKWVKAASHVVYHCR